MHRYDVVQQKSLTTYNKDASSSATLFDGVQSSLAVATDSNMLYRLVEWGYRPEFVDTPQSQAAKAIYLRARGVAKSIATDDMTDVEKVRAVYEWIITNVDYDYGAAAQDLNAPETLKYNAFYLEGVFLDGRAVCDGKAKAFSLLCGLLGINSVRITGTAESGGTSGGHAWNKVLVDTQGNGYKLVGGGTLSLDRENLVFLAEGPVDDEFGRLTFPVKNYVTVANLPGVSLDMYDEKHTYRMKFSAEKASTKYALCIEALNASRNA